METAIDPKELERLLHEAAVAALEAAAAEIAARAQALAAASDLAAHLDTEGRSIDGRDFAETIEAEIRPEALEAEVHTDHPQAAGIEYGTSDAPAAAILSRALYAAVPAIEGAVADAAKRRGLT